MAFSLLISCTTTTKIDGSSLEACEASIEKIEKQLNSEEKSAFENSLSLIVLDTMNEEEFLDNYKEDPELIEEVLQKLDGKTAKNIICEGEKIQEELEYETDQEVLEEYEERLVL